LLANIYLHYVLDLWIHQWRRKYANGEVIVVRFADDFLVGFQHKEDAERMLTLIRERMAQFALELHSEKTRLIEFGRFAAKKRSRRNRVVRDIRLSWVHSHLWGEPERRLYPDAPQCEQTSSTKAPEPSGLNCANECTVRSPNKGAGWGSFFVVLANIMQSLPMAVRSIPSEANWPKAGTAV